MQTQINAPLQALLQTAAMVTPDKQNATVAAKVAQAAEQKMQAQAVPPGIAALLPGVQQQAAQAAQAAQPATQGDVNQLRQMLAQAQQGQGVAQLPGSDVEVAEGGIVGYNGLDESSVKNQVEEILRKAPMARSPKENEILRASGIELSQRPMGNATGIVGLDRFLGSPFLREAFTAGAHKLTEEELRQRGDTGATTEKLFRMLGGSKVDSESPTVVNAASSKTEAPQASYDHEGRVGLASKPITPSAQATPAPRPPVQRPPVQRPPAASPAAAPTEPSFPVESAMTKPSAADARYYDIEGQIKALGERLGKKPEESEAEKAYRTAAMAEYQRGIGGIDAARQRMSESQQKQKEMDLINYLSGMGGGRTLFSGMARSGQALSQAQQQREATRLAYEDKLDERRNIVENLKLATLQQDAERARAWTNELRKNESEIAKLRIGLGEKRMGELATTERSREEQAAHLARSREEMASREKIAREETASRERIARAAQTGDIRKVFDTLQDNARAEFEKWEKSPEGASSVLKPGVREAKRAEFLEKQVALAKAAGVQGLDPLLTSIRAGANTGATVSPEVLSQFKVRPVGQ